MSALKVVSCAPRNTPGNQTQVENSILSGEAGKTCFLGLKLVGSGIWPGLGEDPWDSKAGRWMGERGAGLVRAGLLSWRDAERRFPCKKPESRRVGVIGLVGMPAWPGWLRDKTSGEIAQSWKEHSPLWLLGCLPNLPVAQLAIEVGARGPLETIRRKPDGWAEAMGRVRSWLEGRVDRVLWVEDLPEKASASVWEREES